ncbi:hypothetical protein BDP27DRAFT_1419160 [Rhodocollybia butyracea]|uniref:C2H2-type domain-containing protein n=1 Tax=Rhodocollybia butyracea TaxID=206335 RepID=A0A9P5PZJ1_9AGAR|nr:hypothetical protein BDP27DRAFT_1419160 [Rhodocollybia butyracea]
MPVATIQCGGTLKNSPNQHQQHPPDSLVVEQCDDHPECSPVKDMTPECTDKCVVIVCDDPEHSGSECVHSDTHCDLNCQGGEECSDCGGFDHFLQCCTDLHSYLSEPKTHSGTYPWNGASAPDPSPYTAEQANIFGANHSYPFDEANHSQDNHSSVSSMFVPNVTSDFPFDYSQQYQPIQASFPSHSHSSSPVTSSSPTTQPTSSFSPISSVVHSPAPSEPMASGTADTHSHTCMWGNCNAHFPSPDQLVEHVNSQHLMLAPQVHNAPHPHPKPASCQTVGEDHHKKFSCLWRDCHEFFPDLVDPPDKPHAPYDQFAIHILSQHLGYPGPHLPPLPKFPDDYPKEYLDLYAPSFPSTSDAAVDRTSDTSLSDCGPSRSATPSVEHDVPQLHICQWNNCGRPFDSCDELTSHLTQAHVGGGKPHYDCHWAQCGRNGPNGFTSKQKICRHLQSHTGHRPFQCKLCHQNFSEAATLQQHMRRHTREKPYICDHPGCGKSFAITGALTIHKRTHNGSKPFKCTYCDRCFAESSNLSKHLRTHTGARPYICAEPGCNKAFARPDQLNRHRNVHKKKTMEQASS